MILLGLITCIVLRALTAQAKVVNSFEECKEFFYQGIEPMRMDQNAVKICQKLENKGFYYASLYSVHHKIPLYSAYRLDPTCKSITGRPSDWRLEPQISQSGSQVDHMVREDQNTQDLYNRNQAISRDYSGSGYDRGHLNPSSFQCGDGRTATFTLTNAAPMDKCFNRVHWRRWEMMLRGYLLDNLINGGYSASAFIVTGTVPDPNLRIPQDSKKVTVPSHIWTAICYKQNSDRTSFSFSYIGRNHPEEPDIRLMTVSELNEELSRRYSELSGTQQSIRIFAGDCFPHVDVLQNVQLQFSKVMNLPLKQTDQMSSGTQDLNCKAKRAFSSDSTLEKRVKLDENTGKMTFDSMRTYYSLAQGLEVFTGRTCLITSAKPGAVECQLVPENQKTAADGSRCSNVSESDYSCQCYTGAETKPCCSSPCLYQSDLRYRCFSDQKLIDCTPQYSLITVNGDRCLDDHPCATYRHDYYWCKTANSWDYCIPLISETETINQENCRSNHACAKYSHIYKWCYTDDKNNWDYCL